MPGGNKTIDVKGAIKNTVFYIYFSFTSLGKGNHFSSFES